MFAFSKFYGSKYVLAGAIALLSVALIPLTSTTGYAAGPGGEGKGQGQGKGQHSDGTHEKGGSGMDDVLHREPGADDEHSADDHQKGGKGGKGRDAATSADEEEGGPPPGKGGGKPAGTGGKKGDLFGDLFIILRDANGVPILTDEGWVQPLDAAGDPIPLDEEGHPIDATLTVEVELGRLNVGRAPASVLDRRTDEVIALLTSATAISTDASGRLVLTVDDVDKTIDSPLENLAIYVALMTTGTIPGLSDLPGTDYDFLVDGVLDGRDLAASASFLAAATDKTGAFTSDEIAYINAFLDINTVSSGSVTYSEVDYSSFTYDRSAAFGDVTTTVLVLQPDGSYLPTEVNIYDVVFASTNYTGAGTLDAYTQAADDAREIIEFIHEYDVPVVSTTGN